MIRVNMWLVSVAVLGATAAVMGAGLFWLMLTRPIALAQVLGQVF